MKVHLFKTKKEFWLFDVKQSLVLALFYLPMAIYLLFDVSFILPFALICVFLSVIILMNVCFFSNAAVSITDDSFTFSSEAFLEIPFQKIHRLEAFIEDKSYKHPIFIIVQFEHDYQVIRIDKFQFKSPKKQFKTFKEQLPEALKNSLKISEKTYFTVVLKEIENRGMNNEKELEK